jgi:Domain of unknown function (DUF4386)
MSTVIKAERIAETSPRFTARMAGVFYALEGSAAVFGEIYFRGRFLATGDAATTANNILANESLFQSGFASALLAVAFHITYTVLFYRLFRPVNRTLALLAAFISLVVGALQAFATIFQLAALLVVKGADYLSAFTAPQLHALALFFLNLNVGAYNTYLIFFGFWLIPTGYLILRSTFMPRIIGVLLMIDGVGWVTFLYPPLANTLFPFISVAAALGEIPLLLWLLIVGVNNQRWKEQAIAAQQSLSI